MGKQEASGTSDTGHSSRVQVYYVSMLSVFVYWGMTWQVYYM